METHSLNPGIKTETKQRANKVHVSGGIYLLFIYLFVYLFTYIWL